MSEQRTGVIGASSFAGERLLPLLEHEGHAAVPFSRKGGGGTFSLAAGPTEVAGSIPNWIYVAPIWTVSHHFPLLEHFGCRRLVALSSTSRFTKRESSSAADRALASRLREGEEEVAEWARRERRTVVILQPTMIYGLGKDKNVAVIARFIKRFGFFPLFGGGSGLRQPVHVDDVASACLAALNIPEGEVRTYVLSGGEVLSYRTMVERIFTALGRKPRIIHCPLPLFALAVSLARLFPSGRELTTEMAVRMNRDQQFDHSAAAADLEFQPRPFHPRLGIGAGGW
ncbi:MAG TPA: NAD-dependent epimerase/dehydratase family protein [Desulfobacteraceae bacterium]|nr:NAD-dependent epimerase/dehydratase family protein [Desulfobacteraceae bacterium]